MKSAAPTVPLAKLVGLNALSLERSLEVDPSLMDEEAEEEPAPAPHSHGHGGGHGHSHGEGEAACGPACGHSHDGGGAGGGSSSHGHGHGHGHGGGGGEGGGHGEGHGHGHGGGGGHSLGEGEHCGACEEEAGGHGHGGGKPHRKKRRHDLSGVSSVGIQVEGDVDPDLMNEFMSALLTAHADDIYRSKVMLSLAGMGDVKFDFQARHRLLAFRCLRLFSAPGRRAFAPLTAADSRAFLSAPFSLSLFLSRAFTSRW